MGEGGWRLGLPGDVGTDDGRDDVTDPGTAHLHVPEDPPGLMVVLICVGVMNLVWMAVIAAAILLEKTWKHGRTFSKAVGLAIIVFASLVPLNPALLPGLTAITAM